VEEQNTHLKWKFLQNDSNMDGVKGYFTYVHSHLVIKSFTNINSLINILIEFCNK